MSYNDRQDSATRGGGLPGGGGSGGGGSGKGTAGGSNYNNNGQPLPTDRPFIGRNLSPAQKYAPGARTIPGDGTPSMAGNAQVADFETMNRYLMDPKERIQTPRDYWDAVGNLGKRSNDYNDRGNSVADWLGNHALGMLGVGELDPTKQALGASVGNPDASWGVDPVSVAMSGAGMLTGLPLGLAYQGLSGLTGFHPMISFDGYDYLGTNPAGSVAPQQPGHTDQSGDINRMMGQLGSGNIPSAAPAATTPASPQQGKTVITGSGTVAPAWPWNQVTNP